MYANLTQEEMCNLSGVPRTTYQRIEHGTSDVKFSHLMRIARVLRVPLHDLVS
jgi:transcriptional regulator with XRE-family HTH domain